MADADPSDSANRLDPARRRQLVVRRITQFAVDVGIMTLLCLIPVGAMWLLVPRSPDGTMKVVAGFLAVGMVLFACSVISFGYWVWLPGRVRVGHLGGGGQTAAMRWFRLRVVAESRAPVTRTQLTLRWLMLLVDGIAFGLVAILAMLTSSRAQRLGDTLAQTLVVTERHRRPVERRPTLIRARQSDADASARPR